MRPTLPQPSADQCAHSERLRSHLAATIAAAGGWIPFDRYMREVLYAPGLGYYASGARKIGTAAAGADFVTAPEISTLFAQCLAVQVAQLFDELPARIVEFGAGTGRLAGDLLGALRICGTPCESYSIVEVSAELRARQQARLRDESVEWLDAPPRNWCGVMLANEVLDVMPVRVFAKRGGTVIERGVSCSEGPLLYSERFAAADLLAAVDEIESEVGTLPDGYVSEIGFEARAWMRSAESWLARGALIVIDYGFPRREYYHPQRLMGTLMCHYRQHAHADPFWLPGLNDLTAHVDFSAIARAATEVGLDVLGYSTQAHFLLNCGLLEALQARQTATLSGEANRLLSEAEMGELFKVIAVGRGIEAPLIGFVRGDRRHRL